MHVADDGFRWVRSTPSHSDVEGWLSRSISSTRRRGRASAAARFTDVVVLPTPPLLLTTAVTTWDLSIILSTNPRPRALLAGRVRVTHPPCRFPVIGFARLRKNR